tara:strand:+ start:563 stop:724 length:162 start_codon:yes stop_codon:yes gene_type:complete
LNGILFKFESNGSKDFDAVCAKHKDPQKKAEKAATLKYFLMIILSAYSFSGIE